VVVRVQPVRQAGARPGCPARRTQLSAQLLGGQRNKDRDDLLDGYGVLEWQLPLEQVVLRHVLHPAPRVHHRQGLRALELRLLPDEGSALLVSTQPAPTTHHHPPGSEGLTTSLPCYNRVAFQLIYDNSAQPRPTCPEPYSCFCRILAASARAFAILSKSEWMYTSGICTVSKPSVSE